MRDHLDAHVAARLLERFGLVADLNELLWIELEITTGAAQLIGVQRGIEAGDGFGGRRERHFYALAIEGRDVRVVYDPEARRVISVLPPGWRLPVYSHSSQRSRKDPRDDAYAREGRR